MFIHIYYLLLVYLYIHIYNYIYIMNKTLNLYQCLFIGNFIS